MLQTRHFMPKVPGQTCRFTGMTVWHRPTPPSNWYRQGRWQLQHLLIGHRAARTLFPAQENATVGYSGQAIW